MNKVYVSTGAFKSKNIYEILAIADKYDIRSIELSAGMKYDDNTIKIVKDASKHFNFLVHNYFPTQRREFCLNLASMDKEIIQQSMELCKQAVDLVAYFNADFYSLHCGFTFDGTGKELGSAKQLELDRIPYNVAVEQFVNNIKNLCEYAKSYNVRIAIENNVLAQYAINEDDLYLGVTTQDLMEIIKQAECDNLGILLDLAHAKVSNTFKKFGLTDMVMQLKENIIALHISENNGKFDQNLKIERNSELLLLLPLLKDRRVVLESYRLEPNEIKKQIDLIEEIMQNGSELDS